MKLFLFCMLSLTGLVAHGQTPAAEPKPLTNESEAGVVSINGNTRSESYLIKQKTEYKKDASAIKASGSYIKNSARDNATNDTATNEKWDAGLRYEYEITKDKFSVFAGQNVESDKKSGIDRRYNTDIGGKYTFIKSDTYYNFAELGYRFSKYEYVNDPISDDKVNYLRLYNEMEKKWTETFSNKLWVEYLPSLEDGDDFLLNTEFSLGATLTDILSLKVAYLLKYDNEPPLSVLHKTDTTFSTSLIAKF